MCRQRKQPSHCTHSCTASECLENPQIKHDFSTEMDKLSKESFKDEKKTNFVLLIVANFFTEYLKYVETAINIVWACVCCNMPVT